MKLKEFLQKQHILAVTVLYFLFTVVLTFPLITKFSSQVPEGRGDVFQAFANIQARAQVFETLAGGEKMSFIVHNLGVHLPYVLLAQFFNIYTAYNILFFASFILSGLGMYLLAFYFVRNKNAAFLAGLIFTFAPFHFYQATVVNLGTMHQEWLPFLVLCLFKFFEKFEIKYFLAMGFFAFSIALAEHQMLAFTAIFVGVFVFYKIWMDRRILRNKKLWLCALGAGIFLAVVAFGMFGEMLKVATSGNNFLDAGEGSANKYAINVFDPFLPPVFHSIWGKAGAVLQEFVLGDANRGSYFIGFSVLTVLFYFAFAFKKGRIEESSEKVYRENVFFWSVATLLFYVFSWGISFTIKKHTIYLPYYLIYKFLPFYENIRTTGRLFMFVMLGVAVLFAYGAAQLLKKYPGRKIFLTSGLTLLIVLEFLAAPLPTMSVGHSAFYDKIARDGQQYALLEIPGSTDYEFASYDLYLQTVHGKKVLNGMPLARKVKDEFDMQRNTPVIKQLLYTIPKGNDPDKKFPDPENYFKDANAILAQYNVRYITISKKYAGAKMTEEEEKFINKYIKYNARYEDEFIVAFEVAR